MKIILLKRIYKKSGDFMFRNCDFALRREGYWQFNGDYSGQSHFPGDRTKIASYAKFINSDTLFKEVEYKQAFKIYLFQAFRI